MSGKPTTGARGLTRRELLTTGTGLAGTTALVAVPPPQMVASMKAGNTDAFCAGGPWTEQIIHQGVGFAVCTTDEISRGEATFFDKKAFDPDNPSAHLESLAIKRIARRAAGADAAL